MLLHQQLGNVINTVGMGNLLATKRFHCVHALLRDAIGRVNFRLGPAEDAHAGIDEFDGVLVELEYIVQYSTNSKISI